MFYELMDVEERVNRQQIAEEMMSVLSDKQKKVVQEFYWNQKTHKQIAKENGVKVIGFSENQNDLAPGTVAASIKFDFGKIYSWILDHYMDGKLNGNEVYGVGIEEEIFIPIFTDEVPKEVQQTVENNMK